MSASYLAHTRVITTIDMKLNLMAFLQECENYGLDETAREVELSYDTRPHA